MGVGMWNCDVSICDTGCTGFGDSWGEGQGIITVNREEIQPAYFQGCRHDRDPLKVQNGIVGK